MSYKENIVKRAEEIIKTRGEKPQKQAIITDDKEIIEQLRIEQRKRCLDFIVDFSSERYLSSASDSLVFEALIETGLNAVDEAYSSGSYADSLINDEYLKTVIKKEISTYIEMVETTKVNAVSPGLHNSFSRVFWEKFDFNSYRIIRKPLSKELKDIAKAKRDIENTIRNYYVRYFARSVGSAEYGRPFMPLLCEDREHLSAPVLDTRKEIVRQAEEAVRNAKIIQMSARLAGKENKQLGERNILLSQYFDVIFERAKQLYLQETHPYYVIFEDLIMEGIRIIENAAAKNKGKTFNRKLEHTLDVRLEKYAGEAYTLNPELPLNAAVNYSKIFWTSFDFETYTIRDCSNEYLSKIITIESSSGETIKLSASQIQTARNGVAEAKVFHTAQRDIIKTRSKWEERFDYYYRLEIVNEAESVINKQKSYISTADASKRDLKLIREWREDWANVNNRARIVLISRYFSMIFDACSYIYLANWNADVLFEDLIVKAMAVLRTVVKDIRPEENFEEVLKDALKKRLRKFIRNLRLDPSFTETIEIPQIIRDEFRTDPAKIKDAVLLYSRIFWLSFDFTNYSVRSLSADFLLDSITGVNLSDRRDIWKQTRVLKDQIARLKIGLNYPELHYEEKALRTEAGETQPLQNVYRRRMSTYFFLTDIEIEMLFQKIQDFSALSDNIENINTDEDINIYKEKENYANEAKERIASSYLYLVYKQAAARNYRIKADLFMDLIQEGNLKLIELITKYDINKGVFGKYANRGVTNELSAYISRALNPLKYTKEEYLILKDLRNAAIFYDPDVSEEIAEDDAENNIDDAFDNEKKENFSEEEKKYIWYAAIRYEARKRGYRKESGKDFPGEDLRNIENEINNMGRSILFFRKLLLKMEDDGFERALSEEKTAYADLLDKVKKELKKMGKDIDKTALRAAAYQMAKEHTDDEREKTVQALLNSLPGNESNNKDEQPSTINGNDGKDKRPLTIEEKEAQTLLNNAKKLLEENNSDNTKKIDKAIVKAAVLLKNIKVKEEYRTERDIEKRYQEFHRQFAEVCDLFISNRYIYLDMSLPDQEASYETVIGDPQMRPEVREREKRRKVVIDEVQRALRNLGNQQENLLRYANKLEDQEQSSGSDKSLPSLNTGSVKSLKKRAIREFKRILENSERFPDIMEYVYETSGAKNSQVLREVLYWVMIGIDPSEEYGYKDFCQFIYSRFYGIDIGSAPEIQRERCRSVKNPAPGDIALWKSFSAIYMGRGRVGFRDRSGNGIVISDVVTLNSSEELEDSFLGYYSVRAGAVSEKI
ncbi:MAG: hypothetical protein IKG46_13840 [Solobacterium sp.]|nr:hypothetical protein [Solobacterium sp.]